MEKDFEYYGVMIRLESNNYLFILRENGLLTNGISVSGKYVSYESLLPEQLALVHCKLYDGTELMNLEKILETNDFENIFFKLLKLGVITAMDGETPMEVKQLIKLNKMEDFVCKVFEDYNTTTFEEGKIVPVESIIKK